MPRFKFYFFHSTLIYSVCILTGLRTLVRRCQGLRELLNDLISYNNQFSGCNDPLSRGVHPPEPMKHSPLFQKNLTFQKKIFSFSAKISDDLFSLTTSIPSYFSPVPVQFSPENANDEDVLTLNFL